MNSALVPCAQIHWSSTLRSKRHLCESGMKSENHRSTQMNDMNRQWKAMNRPQTGNEQALDRQRTGKNHANIQGRYPRKTKEIGEFQSKTNRAKGSPDETRPHAHMSPLPTVLFLTLFETSALSSFPLSSNILKPTRILLFCYVFARIL